jgi:hypothetical protein
MDWNVFHFTWGNVRLPQLEGWMLSLAFGEFNIVERLRDPHRWDTKSAIVLEWGPITSGAPTRRF